MILEHGGASWRVGKLVAEAQAYRLYICTDESTGQERLLQVAATPEFNSLLDKTAFTLNWLKHESDRMETETPDPSGRRRNYDRLFPLVAGNFVCAEQGDRQIVVLALKDVDDVSVRMYPLSVYRDQGGERLDLKSSAWIMGRLLKLLGLAHSQGIAVNLLVGGNVLISPEDHFAVVFDWTASVLCDDAIVPAEYCKRDIASAAQAVFASIGGDPETGVYPYLDTTDPTYSYVELLWSLASNPERDATAAHRRFYELVDRLWGVVFHPFTTKPL